ncbi:MAG: ABC transporter permease [Candidatus Thorarchaeota archaeon]
MRILWKKVYREFRHNRFRSLVILLSVAIAVGLLVGLANAWSGIEASVEKNQLKTRNAEVRLNFEPKWINEQNVTAIADNAALKEEAGLASENLAEGRIFLRAQVQYKSENYSAYWIALNNTQNEPNQINKLLKYKGQNYFSNPSAPEILLDYHFGANQPLLGKNVKIDEELKIFYGNKSYGSVEVKGIVRDAEYSYVVDDQTFMPFMGDLCVFYAPLEWTRNQLFANGEIPAQNVINQILIKTDEHSTKAADHAIEVLGPFLAANNAYFYPVTYKTTPDYNMITSDAGTLDRFGYAFGGIGLIIGAIVVYNSLVKLVGSQRTYIGLMEAMGAKRREITLHFILMGIILGFFGWILGCIFGYLLSWTMVELMVPVYGYKYTAHVMPWDLFALAFVATMAIMIIFSILACLPVLRITPREAMTNIYVRAGARRLWLERFLSKIPKLGGLTFLIPLREVFMHKRRSTLTAIAIAVSSIVVIASAGFLTSFFYAVDQNYSKYETYDVQVIFENDIQSQKELLEYVRSIDGVDPGAVEPMFSRGLYVARERNGETAFSAATIQCFWRNSSLRNPHVIKGEKETSRNQILAGKTIAKDIGLSVNQEVTLDHTTPLKVKIGGIVGQLFDNYLIWTLEDLYEYPELFGISEGTVNGVIFNVEEGANLNTIRSQLVGRFGGILAFVNVEETKRLLGAMMELLLVVMGIFYAVGLIVLGVFAFNTIFLAMLDRQMEYVALRAIGARRRSLYKIIGLETLIIAVIGFIAAIPIGYYASSWLFDYIMRGRWYLPVYLPLEIWVVVAILSFASVFLAAATIAWRTNRMSLPDVLRDRQIG